MNSSLQQGSMDFDGEPSFCEMNISSQVQTEFQHAEFGDARLTDRLVQIGDRRARAWLPEDVRPMFVYDRAADDFSLYAEIIDEMDNAGFVVRAQYNRRFR